MTCCPFNCFGLCRRLRPQPRNAGQGPEDIELQNVPPAPQGHSSAPEGGHASTAIPTNPPPPILTWHEIFEQHRVNGALQQSLIDNPRQVENRVNPLAFQISDLTQGRHLPGKWEVRRNAEAAVPQDFHNDIAQLGLSTQCWQLAMRNGPPRRRTIFMTDDSQQEPHNVQYNAVAEGYIIAIDIKRADGPHWSEIALALYISRHAIETLRHIYFQNIVNEDVMGILLPMYSILLGTSQRVVMERIPPGVQTIWQFGTPGYQALMGTAFGKAVAALLLAAFPNGGYRVARIVTFKAVIMQMRFDILPRSELQDPPAPILAPQVPAQQAEIEPALSVSSGDRMDID